MTLSPISYAGPQGGEVVGGSATISTDGNTTQINQSSQSAIINWQSYNVGASEHVNYQQPNASSIALNRINPEQGASQIYGMITANGQVWLINPAGIYFGPSARVNVAGLLATTANISNEDFMAGRYHFMQSVNWNGAIINEGIITIHNAGLAAFAGTGVVNKGLIEANMGTVVLAGTREFTVDFSGDQLIQIAPGSEVSQYAFDQNGNQISDVISNAGTIIANGGKVLMNAKTAGDVLDHAINMKGIAQAKTVNVHNGEIVLNAGDGRVTVTGKLIADGRHAGEKGGTVKVLGKQIAINHDAVIDASGHFGGGVVLIGGNAHGAGPEKNAEHVFVGANSNVYADAIENGDGGKVVVWADKGAQFYGNIYARGGSISGEGGWVETSGKEYLVALGYVNATAPAGQIGTWLLDPKNIDVITGGTSTLAQVDQFSDSPTSSLTIAPATINAAGANVTLQANNDITFTNSVSIAGAGRTLTVQAGRDITIASGVSVATNNAAIAMTANDSAATGANRDAGTGNIIMGTGSSISAGTSTLTLTIGSSVASPFSPGSMTLVGLTGSTITLTSPNAITGTGNVAASTGLVANVGTASSFGTGVISGGTLTKQGAGTLTLSGTNTYTGLTTVSAGTLSITNNSGLGTTAGGVTVTAGATLNLNAVTVGAEAFTLNGTGDAGVGALTVTGTSSHSGTVSLASDVSIGGTGNLTLTGVVSGASTNDLTKIGVGTLELNSEVNTYTGITFINEGTLEVTEFADAAIVSSLGAPAVAQAGIRIGSGSTVGTLSYVGPTATDSTTRPLILGAAGGGISIDPSKTITFSGGMTGGGASATLTKLGTGAVTVSTVAWTYTGATNISVGQFNSGITNALPTGTALTVDGTVDLVNSAQTIASLSGTGTLTHTSTSGGSETLTVGDSTSTTFSGVLAGTEINITKTGTGTLTLSGGSANTYNGTTLVSQGTLKIAKATGLGAGTAATTISSGATVEIDGVTISNGEDFTISGVGVGGAGALIGTGTASLGSGSTITLAASSTLGGTGTLTLNGVITDGGSTFNIIKTGTGTIDLTNANTYDGTTTINDGTLRVSNATALGTATGATIVNSGGTVDINNVTIASGEDFTLNGVGASSVGAMTGTGTAVLNSGSLITLGSTTTFGGTGTLTLNGAISDGASSFGIAKAGAGTVVLAAANTYDGTTTVGVGTLSLTNVGALGSSSSTSVTSGATLDLNFASSTLTNTNTITLNGTGVSGGALRLTGNSITVNNPLSIASDTTIGGAGTGAMVFGGAITGANSLTFNLTGASASLSLPSINLSGTKNLSVTTNAGAISQTNAFTITGTSSFSAGAAAITVANAGNDFTGAVSASNTGANAIQIRDTNALVLGTVTTSNTLTLTAGGNVTQSGVVTANTLVATLSGASSALSLNTQSNNITNLGAITAPNGFSLTNGNNSSTVTGAINTSGNNGAININVGTGTYSQNDVDLTAGAGAITITSDAIAITNNTGDNAMQTTSSLTLKPFSAGTAMSLAGASAYDLTAAEIVDIAGGVTGAGTITIGDAAASTGVMTIGGAVSFGAKPVSLFAGSFTDGDNAGRTITATSLNLTARNSGGAIGGATGNNAIDVAVTNLTFTTTNGGAFINATGGINFGSGTSAVGTGAIGVTATGAIAQTGAITQTSGAGTVSFTTGGATIALNNASNDFIGAVSLTNTGANAVSITDANAIILGTSSVGSSTFSVTATGANSITQTGAITQAASAGAATFTTGGGVITLTQSNDFTGAVSASNTGANAISITDTNALLLGTVTTSNTLTLVASGNVSQSGVVTANTLVATLSGASSALSLNTQSNNITNIGAITAPNGFSLTNGNNATTVTGAINTSGNNGAVSINVGTGTYSQNDFDITAGAGAITITSDAIAIAANTGNNAMQTTSSLTLKPFSAATAMSLAGSSAYDLTAAEIVDIAGGVTGAGTITIGDAAASTGTLTIGGAVSFGAKPVSLFAGSFTDSNTTGNTITATSLNLTARNNGGGIGSSTANNAIDVIVTNLTFNTNNGDAYLNASGSVNIGASASAVGSGAIGLTSSGAITQSGAISGASLTTNSVGGVTLGSANAVNSFNATNTGGGTISLTNTAAPLSISGISQSGSGNVSISNTGNISITGSVSAGASNNVSLTSSGTIAESGAGLISGSLLTTNSVGGQTLNGANTVSSFNATNTGGGAISLTNTAAPLTITGLSQSGSGDFSVNNSGAISITGTVAAGGSNNVSLTSSGTIAESGAGLISGSLLTTSSVGGQTLNGANALSSFNATNITSGDIQFTDSNSINVTGISQAGGGAVNVTAGGANNLLTISGGVSSSGADITYTADNMTLSSTTNAGAGTVTLQPNSSGQLINLGGADSAGTLGLTNTEINTITANRLRIGRTNSGNLSVTAAISSPATNLSLINNGSMSQTGGSTLTATNLKLSSAGAVTLNEANVVGTLAANVSGSTNAFSFTNASALDINTVDGTSGITTNNGAISLTASTGALTLSQSVNAGSAAVGLTASASTISELGAATVTGGTLTTNSVGATTLNNSNAISAFNATASSGGAIAFTNSTGFDVSGISTTGTVNLIAGDAITQSGAASGSTLTVKTLKNGGASISLTNSANDFATINLSARNAGDTANDAGAIAYTDATGFDVSGINTTSTVNLTANNALTQSGEMVGSTLTAKTLNNSGAAITFDNANNDFATISLSARNAADGANAAGALTYTDLNGFDVASIRTTNTATLTGKAALTQSGAIVANSLIAKTLNNAGAVITFDNSSNAVSTIDLQTLNNAGSALRAGAISFTDSLGFAVANISTTSTIDLISSGAISQTGALTGTNLTTTSVGGVVLNNAGNDVDQFNATNTGGGDIHLVNTTVLAISGINQTGAGNLTIDNAANITVSGDITATGGALNTTLLGGNNITYNANVTTNGGTFLSTSQNATTIGNSIAINAGAGTVTFNANAIGSGGQDFTMNAGSSITTTNTTSSAVAINVNAAGGGTGRAALRDITTGAGGKITVATNTGGNITGDDIIQSSGTLNVGSTGTIELTVPQISGSSIGTSGARIQVLTGALSAVSGDAGLFIDSVGTGLLTLGTTNTTGAFTLSSAGSVAQSGVITVAGLTTLIAGANDVTFTNINNDFNNVRITSGNNVTLRDVNALVFDTSDVTGTLTATAGDTITQSNDISGDTLIAKTLNNTGAGITLTDAANDFNTINLSARNAADSANVAGAIAYTDANGFDVSGVNTTSTVDLIGKDALTQSGAMVGSTLTAKTLRNGGAAITFDNVNNDFATINLSARNAADGANAAGAIAYTDATGFDVSGINTTSTVNLIGKNALTQSGAMTGSTLTVKTLNNSGASISLNGSNEFATINLSARNLADSANAAGAIAYTDASDFDVSGINTASTINLISGAAITDSGAITGTALTTQSVNGTILDFGHFVTGFNATNTNTSGANITFVNTASLLTISGITQSGIGNNGNVVVTNTGAMTTSGAIATRGGDVSLTTLSPDSSERLLTIGSNITTGVSGVDGGDISLIAANNSSGSTTALIINSSLDINTSPGTDGELTIGGGLSLGSTPTVGAGDITLDGNGLDLTLGTLNFTSSTNFFITRYITVNGALTSDAGVNLDLKGDKNNIGTGGVYITGAGSINSGGTLTLQGSNLSGLGGADATAGVQIASGATVQAAGAITIQENTGNSHIVVDGTVTATGVNNITMTPAGTGTIKLGATVSSQGGVIGFAGPVALTNNVIVDSGNGGSSAVNFANTVSGATRTLTLQNNISADGIVTFSGDVTLAGLTTFSQPYAVVFNGSTNTFTNAVTFNNTSGVTLGNGSDTFNFNGGLTSTASTTTLNGTVNTTNDVVSLGTVSLGGTSVISSGSGSITLGNVSGAEALTLTSTFNSTLNGTVNIGSLTMNGGGTDIINTSSITTSGSQLYSNDVSFGASSTLSSGANITFNGDINGGGFDLSLTGTGSGGNIFTLTNDLSSLDDVTVTGGSGSNQLALQTNSATQTWNVTGTNSGNVALTGVAGNFAFSAIQSLSGGANTDNFTLNGGTLSGSINGAGGTNTLTGGNVVNTWSITGANAGSVTGVSGGFSNIQNLVGGSTTDNFTLNGGTLSGSINGSGGTNTLTADNVVNTWTITAANAGSVTGVSGGFSNIQSLVGGSTTDNFNFNNNINFNGGINGSGGTNTLDYSAYTGGNAISASVTGANSGSVVVGANTATFSNIGTVVGGAGNDTFNIGDSGSIGTLTGNSGTNTLSYAGDTIVVSVNLQTAAATGVGSYSGITNFVGDDSASGSNSTLTGPDGVNTWAITSANAGNLNASAYTFSGFGNLTGGNTTDNFVFSDNVTLSGAVNGAVGANSLDYSAYDSTHAINASVTSADSGSVLANSVTMAFSNIANISGGAGADSFAIGASGSIGTVTGNAGSDTFSIAAGGTATTLAGGAGTNSLTVGGGNTWNITGSNAGNITSIVGSFTNMQSLTGGTGVDNFVFADNINFNGSIDGGITGTNTLDYSAYTSANAINASVTAANSGSVLANGITLAFSNVGSVAGGAGADTFSIGASGSIDTLTGNAGSDTFSIAAGGTATTLSGNAGTNSLSVGGGNTWNITGANAGNVTGVVTSFTNMNSLTGGTGADSFVFANNINFDGSIDGGTGTNALDYSAYTGANPIDASVTGSNSGSVLANSITLTFSNISSIAGGADGDTFSIGSSGSIDTLTGNGGNDSFTITAGGTAGTLSGNAGTNTLSIDGGNTWNITGANAGNITSVVSSFTNMQSLIGGANADSFVFADNINFDGTINGGAGSNTLDYSAYTSANAIDANITGANVGNVVANSMTADFSNIGTVVGGAGNDSFSLTGSGSINTLTGNAGDDSFTLASASTVGTLSGNSGTNTLSIAGGHTWNITGSNAGDVTSSITSFTGIQSLIGGSSADSFVFADNINFNGSINGAGAANIFDYSAYTSANAINASVTGTNSGSVLANSITTTFSNIRTIIGGAGDDTFHIGDSGDINTLTGNGGTNTLSYAGDTIAVSVNLQSGATTGVSSYTGITNFVGADGTSGSNSTLIGTNTSNTWAITSANAGNLNLSAYTFSGFGNVTGGNTTDDFVFSDNATLSGAINGAGGTNSLDYSAYGSTHAINASVTGSSSGSVLANSVTMAFSNIDSIAGGAGNDTFSLGASGNINTLAGNAGTNSLSIDGGNTWNITGSNAGNVSGAISSFTGMQSLIGGAGADSFVFDDNVNFDGSINGNGGTNTLDYSAYTSANAVNASVTGSNSGSVLANSITLAFSNIGSVAGGAGADTFSIGASGGIDTLTGNAGSDTFSIAAGGTATTLAGNAGTNSLSVSDGNTWNITGANAGNVTSVVGSFTNMQSLTGGTGVDNFVFADNINFDGTIDGGITGTNTLDYSAYTSANAMNASVTATNSGSVLANSITLAFSNINNLTGGAGNDTFSIGASGSIDTLTGNAGSDTFSITSGGTATTLSGNAGTNSLSVSGGNTWNMTGANAGNITGVVTSFTGMQSLTGGTGADSFVFLDNINFDGSIDGGSTGTNTLDYSAYTSANAMNASVTAANSGSVLANSITLAFSNINNLTGGAGNDTFNIGASGSIGTVTGNAGSDTFSIAAGGTATTLSGNAGTNSLSVSGGNTWNITGSNAGDVSGVVGSFTNMQSLTGGTGADSFVFDDNVNFDGSINGNNGGDTLNYSAYTSGNAISASVTGSNSGSVLANSITLAFSNINNLTGGAGADVFSIGASGSIGTVTGNAGSDTFSITSGGTATTLAGGAGTNSLSVSGGNTWNMTGANAGNITSVVGSFTNMQSLTGGTGADSFVFDDNINFNGSIDGGSTGTNTLDYSAYTSGNAISASVTGSNSGSVVVGANTATFSNIANLTGGAGNDTFNIGDSGSIGTLTGNSGTNTLSYAGDTIAVNVNLQTGTATNTGGFSNISNFTGGSASDTLTGANSSNTWNVTSANAGNINSAINFSSFENIIGGTAGDTFNLGGSLTSVIGQGGDTLNYTAGTLGSVNFLGTVAINSTSVVTTGNQTYSGVATLNANTLLNTTGGNILFGNAVNGATRTLSLQNTSSGGTVTFNGNVTLAGLTTAAQGYQVIMNGASNTISGAVTMNNTGGLTLGGGGTFNFNGALTNTAGTTNLNGTLNTNGSLLQLGAIALNGNSAINTSNGIATFTTLTGPYNASIDTGTGLMNVNGAINIGGALTLQGSTMNLNGGSISASGVTIGASAIQQALLGSGLSIASNGNALTFNSKLDGAQNLTLNAGGANVFLNADVGSVTPLSAMTVQSVGNFTSLGTVNAASYNQTSGSGTTNFDNAGLATTGNATVVANNLIGNVNVASFTINLSTGNMFGTVNGLSGEDAIRLITVLNPLVPNTIFFDGIDISTVQPPTPPAPPVPPTPSIPNGINNGTIFPTEYSQGANAPMGYVNSEGMEMINAIFGNGPSPTNPVKSSSNCVQVSPFIEICTVR